MKSGEIRRNPETSNVNNHKALLYTATKAKFPNVPWPASWEYIVHIHKMKRVYAWAACYAGITAVTAQNFDPGPGQSNIHWDASEVGTNKSTNATYSNPVMTSNGGDPWMTRYSMDGEDWYLFTYSTNDNITIKRSRYLTDNWDTAETKCIFQPDANSREPWSTDIWAPEIHNISNTW